MDYYKIGQRVRALRRGRDLSQEALAERVGISVTHMSHIETGNTKLSLPVLLRLSQELGVGTDDLLREDPGPRSPAAEELEEVLTGCTAGPRRILLEVARATRAALLRHGGGEDEIPGKNG